MSVIYQNEHYEVHLVRSDEEGPYQLVSKEHGIVEAKESNLPQILVYAEQFNHMLKIDFHKKVVNQLDMDYNPFNFTTPTGEPH